MRSPRLLPLVTFLIISSALCTSANAQAPGAISFSVRITPSTGIAEPVRGLPFYLLRKSFAAIEQQAAASQPKPDMEKFIDSLKVSPQLKTWMKKHHTVRLTGEAFSQNLTPKAILNVPEFWKAYDQLNISNKQFGYPVAKYKPSDRVRNPAKYQREVSQFHARILHYIQQNPYSKDGMDEMLQSIDPSPRWFAMLDTQHSAARRAAFDLAQSRYFVAQTQTDLNGNAGFSNVPPGSYWITCLNVQADIGDTRAKWDVPVTVRAGTTTKLLLSNFNSVPPPKSSF